MSYFLFSSGEADSFHSDCFVLRLLNEGCKGKELSDLKCALKIRTEIRRWLRKQKTMRILVVGKLNIGKTTLVKGLLNSSYGIPKEQHTTKVTQYQHAQDYVNLIFYDTPGLVKSNDNAIHGIKEPNLLIFALKMDDKTLQEEDKGAIESVTKAYGWRVWKNAMFVLTYANRVVKLGTAPRENKVHFNGVIYDYKIEITNKLLELQVQEYFANHIPVVPVGLASEPFIESDGRKIYGRKISWVSLRGGTTCVTKC